MTLTKSEIPGLWQTFEKSERSCGWCLAVVLSCVRAVVLLVVNAVVLSCVRAVVFLVVNAVVLWCARAVVFFVVRAVVVLVVRAVGILCACSRLFVR